ncbi:glucosamine--fructose-6-phosphate aminotransferase [Paramecium bursaria Chlorella virus NE-JV-1]|nr:glucosamine--fructose-6-phosphate aminotransferase [Paramecium bursaria Chlorella virus NE-JV-1]
MCGIFGIVANSSAISISLDGIEKLEYRGYDSCGLAFPDANGLKRIRSVHGIDDLRRQSTGSSSSVAIAHSRWSTTGVPSVINAHPHFSIRDEINIAVVHNGIIENYQELRAHLASQGFEFESQTDTEVIAHLIRSFYDGDLLEAVRVAVSQLHGSYAIAVICNEEADSVVVAKYKSPLVIGMNADGSICIASDPIATTTDKIMYVDDGIYGKISPGKICMFDNNKVPVPVEFETIEVVDSPKIDDKFPHHMIREIYAQPASIKNTIANATFEPYTFGDVATAIFPKVQSVVILACGTSYNAGLIAKNWFETIAHKHCDVYVASEYEPFVPRHDALVVTISQSGETADTILALHKAKKAGMLYTLTICNSPKSTIVRESAMKFITKCGPELSVASTKAFTSQLAALFILANVLGGKRDSLALETIPEAVERTLGLVKDDMLEWAEKMFESNSALFLGRGLHAPVAYEGALKLKEISYIHAEGIAAGELKHGPLALLNKQVPVIVTLADHSCLDKLKSNIDEVLARNAKVYVITEQHVDLESHDNLKVVKVPFVSKMLSPIIHAIPMQLLSYYIAVLLGRNVDRPIGLAKSVTVE